MRFPPSQSSRHVVIGQICIATPLSAQQQESIRRATERLWSLLRDNPHTLVGPRVGDELIARMDADKSLCPLETQTFPDVTLRVYRRGC
jgi:hypothetical protein